MNAASIPLLETDGQIEVITIRPAKESDLPRILEVNLKAIFETCSSHYPIEQLKQWVGDRTVESFNKSFENNQLFVAEADGQISGFLDVISGEVLAVYVDQQEERKGIGGALLKKGIQEAEKDSDEVVVYASLNAVSFYEKFGFQTVKEVKHARNGVDLPLLEMRLGAQPE